MLKSSTQATMTEPSTLKIERTNIYGTFKLMSGNRTVDYNHVKRLKRSIESDPELLPSNPIQVNENMFVIDGQHRLLAAKELGRDIYYIVSPGLTLDATRKLNTTQRRWSPLDFAKSYADSGVEDYKQILEVHAQYPNISLSVTCVYLAGGRKKRLEEDFRRGEFKVDGLENGKRQLNRLAMIMDKTGMKNISGPMAFALWQVFHNDKFDFDKFINKLDNETARQRFESFPIVRSCLRSIEEVYNFHSPSPTRLY